MSEKLKLFLPHVFFACMGAGIGYGVAKLASSSHSFRDSWPVAFIPFGHYIVPIGLAAAAIAAVITALLSPYDRLSSGDTKTATAVAVIRAALFSPPRKGVIAGDLAALLVCVAISKTILVDRPAWFPLFTVAIWYGFVGHLAGSIAAEGKAMAREWGEALQRKASVSRISVHALVIAILMGPGLLEYWTVAEVSGQIGPLTDELSKSSTESGRWAAVYALGETKDPRAVVPLIGALKDDVNDVRQAAAFGLGEIRDPRAIVPLIDALKDPSLVVRQRAVSALRRFKDPHATEALKVVAKNDPAAEGWLLVFEMECLSRLPTCGHSARP